MTFKPIDAKRDEFRKYLERSGALDAISKVFIKLFESQERPENAIQFIRVHLGDAMEESDTIEFLKKELEDCRNEISQLKMTISNLKLEKTRAASNASAGATSNVANTETDDTSKENVKVENVEIPESEVKPKPKQPIEIDYSAGPSSAISEASNVKTDTTVKESEPKKISEEN